jgi:hypothetical protein
VGGTERDAEGIERLGEVYAAWSTTVWSGSPELRVLLVLLVLLDGVDFVDLVDEPAPDVLWLLGEIER